MVHIFIDDDLIDKIRPLVEDEWEKLQREEGKKILTASKVVMRLAQKAYEIGKRRPTP